MVDILLIQPPVEDFYFTYKRSIPYGLASIAASLRKAFFSVEIIDSLAVIKSKVIPYPEEMGYLKQYYGESDSSIFSLFHDFRHYGYSFEHIAGVVRETNPSIVGISSLFTAYSNVAERMAVTIRRSLPGCVIVMGGHHPTALPQKVMKCAAVDFVLRGEGEISMPLLALRLRNGEGVDDVPGIVFRKNRSSHFCSAPTGSFTGNSLSGGLTEVQYDPISEDEDLHISEPAWIRDFSELPLPAMDLVNMGFYSRGISRRSGQVETGSGKGSVKLASTVVVAGRGCPMPCSYCSVGSSSSHGKFRQRSVEDVINELSIQFNEYDMGFIDFEDENLTLNREWFLHLMDELIKISSGKEVELRAMNGLYPPSLDEELIVSMKRAGFRTLNLSLGSTSAEQLSRFRRPDVRKSFERILSIVEKHSLATVSYIIAGAPGQSAESSLDDILFLAARKTLIGLSIFYPAPGSVDYGRCIEKKLLPSYFSLMRSSALPVDDTTTRLQSVTLLRITRVINYLKSKVHGDSMSAAEIISSLEEAADSSGADENRPGGHDRDIHAALSVLEPLINEGKLKGVRKDGTFFDHNVDRDLCGKFVERLKSVRIAKCYPSESC